jgi:hypothetical protein
VVPTVGAEIVGPVESWGRPNVLLFNRITSKNLDAGKDQNKLENNCQHFSNKNIYYIRQGGVCNCFKQRLFDF